MGLSGAQLYLGAYQGAGGLVIIYVHPVAVVLNYFRVVLVPCVIIRFMGISHGHPFGVYVAPRMGPSHFMCGCAREELGQAEVLELFLSSTAINMLGCLCLQHGVR